jgi:hypothetical protein
MKRILIVTALMIVASLASSCCSVCPGGPGGARTADLGVLRHLVLFKWKDGTPPATVKAIEDAFRALPGRIPGIQGFEWGTDVSPEKLAQGFTHCFFVTFPDTAARDVYLPHPAHKEFVELMKPHLDQVLVVDYVAKD